MSTNGDLLLDSDYSLTESDIPVTYDNFFSPEDFSTSIKSKSNCDILSNTYKFFSNLKKETERLSDTFTVLLFIIPICNNAGFKNNQWTNATIHYELHCTWNKLTMQFLGVDENSGDFAFRGVLPFASCNKRTAFYIQDANSDDSDRPCNSAYYQITSSLMTLRGGILVKGDKFAVTGIQILLINEEFDDWTGSVLIYIDQFSGKFTEKYFTSQPLISMELMFSEGVKPIGIVSLLNYRSLVFAVRNKYNTKWINLRNEPFKNFTITEGGIYYLTTSGNIYQKKNSQSLADNNEWCYTNEVVTLTSTKETF